MSWRSRCPHPHVYSTAAYYVAAVVAILFGLSPKFGAVIAATPGGVLGGITVVLYGMIGLLGAKIWRENGVDFGNPINLVPVAAGIIIAIGDTTLRFTDDFSLSGIALGTIVTDRRVPPGQGDRATVPPGSAAVEREEARPARRRAQAARPRARRRRPPGGHRDRRGRAWRLQGALTSTRRGSIAPATGAIEPRFALWGAKMTV